MTAGETTKLEKQQQGINREVNGMREENGGKLSKAELDAAESVRRARMRASREGFRTFVKSLPYMGDSTELIREDRDHAH